MPPHRRHFVSVISLIAAFVTQNAAFAQPLGKHHESVESLVAPAVLVALGSIARVEERVIVAPGASDSAGIRSERGKFEYLIETQFDDILKQVGRAGDDGEFKSFRTLDPNAGKNERLAKWAAERTPGVWIIFPKYERESFHRWQFIPRDEPGINQFGYTSSSLRPPMFARDLSILKDRESIVQRIREYSSISQMEHRTRKPSVVSVRIPSAILGEIEGGDFNELKLPIDSILPETARRLIESPNSFVSEAKSDSHTLDMLCLAGIDLLGEMNTDESVQLLKDCLDEKVLPFKHSSRDHLIRTKAFERLLDWHVEITQPSFGDKIQKLFLSSTNIDNDTLKIVSELVNLEYLYLWETDISHVGIEHLSKLRHLKLIALDDGHLTDNMLRTLRKQNQLHTIYQANPGDEQSRPNSVENVSRLEFWCAPFTDRGLKEFVGFKNVTVIELGRMEITDAGVSHLKKFEKLKRLRLHETRISDKGIEELQRALPHCVIENR